MSTVDNLCEVTEATMLAAHKAGVAFYRYNVNEYKRRNIYLSQGDAQSVARSTGWHGELMQCWTAGFTGERRRDTGK